MRNPADAKAMAKYHKEIQKKQLRRQNLKIARAKAEPKQIEQKTKQQSQAHSRKTIAREKGLIKATSQKQV